MPERLKTFFGSVKGLLYSGRGSAEAQQQSLERFAAAMSGMPSLPATALEGEFVYNPFGTRWRPFLELGVDDPFWYRKPGRGIAEGYPKHFRPGLLLRDWQEEYFELVDVVESAVQARGSFCMMELGANFGRWLQMALGALGKLNPSVGDLFLLGVEGEPTHHAWLRQTFLDNGVPEHQYEALYGAVYSHDGSIEFSVGNPAKWRGQAIGTYGTHVTTPCFALGTLLAKRPRWDLIDADVQGAEVEVFASCIAELDRRVRKVHIGTHGRAIEKQLRRLFTRNGWIKLWDFPCAEESATLNAEGTRIHNVPTPFGEVVFNDGVQTWLNPRLESSLAPA